MLTYYYLVNPQALPSYRDEEVYIACGREYVFNFSAPYSCNFEHPPFGKYLIGFADLLGFGRLLYLFFMLGSSFLVYVLVRFLLGSDLLGFLAGVFLVLDTVFFNSHRFLLLDPPAIFFTLLSMYFILVRSSPIVSAFFFGLGVASKLSVAPYFIVFAYVLYWRFSQGVRLFTRELLVFVFVAFLTYLSTYLADLRLGPHAIIQHHLDMLSYVSWRHGFSTPIAVNGLMKLVSKVEVWRYGGELTIYLTTLNATLNAANTTFTPGSGYYVIVGVGAGSILWYVMLPSLLINTYWALTERLSRAEVTAVVAGWASLTTILPGPIDWYYVIALPTLYANVALLLGHLIKGRWVRVAVVSLTTTQVIVTLLTLTGFLPWRIILR